MYLTEEEVSQDIHEAIFTIPANQWNVFFENLRQLEYRQLGLESPTIPLTDIPVRVKMLNELENSFVQLANKKPKH